jgi:hypothetical protein
MLSSRSASPAVVFVLATFVTGCNPYERFGANDDGLGPVDPITFPAANLGAGGNRKMPGNGAFTALRAYVGGMPIEYFSYALPPPTDADPLRVEEDDAILDPTNTPTAYVFGPGCTPPPGYVYDPRLDEVAKDYQGNILTALPTASYVPERAPRSTYVPVVAAAPVTAAGVPCQKAKSAAALTSLIGALPEPNHTYLAWLVIDPGAAVYPFGKSVDDHPGVGLQAWGWFNRYLAAYLDGGEIPTADMMVMEGEPAVNKKVKAMVTQKIYYPRSMVIGAGAMPMMAAGKLGAGYDVLTAKRGAAGYSPVCEIFTYDTGMPMTADQLPKDAATITAMYDTMAAPIRPGATPYVYCLQMVQP